MPKQAWLFFYLLICSAKLCAQGEDDVDYDPFLISSRATEPCESLDCSRRTCSTDLTCTETRERLEEHKSVCGCCPKCVSQLVQYEACSPTNGPKCGLGLECINNNCTLITTAGDTCNSQQQPNRYWKPKCLSDGSFAPVQCKGEKQTGRCFCFSAEGKRIFGQEWWQKADNMTCACSRKVSDLMKNRTDVTLHCNEQGNYEPLQCDNKLCWCSEELTGDPITATVPEALVSTLPCYDEKVLGSQYLRQCESMQIAQARIEIEMKFHGTNYIRPNRVFCDYDGSYSSYQINEYQILYCSWKDASKLGTWATQVGEISKVNCNCARDSQYYKESGLQLPLICEGNGNYLQQQEADGKWYCVDRDGFGMTEPTSEPRECPPWPST